jgi:hypothetical protein
MKAKEAIKRYGSLDKLVKKVSKIAADNNLWIDVSCHVNEEDPTDEDGDFLNIVFEVPFDCSFLYSFQNARDRVNNALLDHDLQLLYECGGDGERGTLMSYRVEGLC